MSKEYGPKEEKRGRLEELQALYSGRRESLKEAYPSRIEGEVDAEKVVMGVGVRIEKGAVITGKSGSAERVVLGDFSYIGRETRVMVPEFWVGDYTKLHEHSFAHGEKPMRIGRNCWIGGHVVLDSNGGLDIDDNVGIGAQSQLWTHIQFGDIVEGSRFYSRKYMYVGKDAWFVGHCIVSPVSVGERSMALVGSVVTKDMLPNRVYAGVPAEDVTHKMGPQFEERTVDEKIYKMEEIISDYVNKHPEHQGKLKVGIDNEHESGQTTFFDVSTRTYNKTLSQAETDFLKKHIPLIKFYPREEPSFVVQNSDEI